MSGMIFTRFYILDGVIHAVNGVSFAKIVGEPLVVHKWDLIQPLN
jgi:hypothetical protein